MSLNILPSTSVSQPVSFEEWTGGRRIQSIGTNAGSVALPFQSWRNFKEAFAPELVYRAVNESPVRVLTCLDPFGGSGTTALACQFLAVKPITIEVNPYLADLIESKLTIYEIRELARDFASLVRTANKSKPNPQSFFSEAPPTFIEPGMNGRWIFDQPVAQRLTSYVKALQELSNPRSRRLFRALLGGVLINASNVVVSGKGRRYRRKWNERRLTATDLDEAFCEAVENAIEDIMRFGDRAERTFKIFRGDARKMIRHVKSVDLSVFSPPYPNSFDYTDVYNVELWALRYLTRSIDNRRLRNATLTSHVQVKRSYAPPPEGSSLLRKVTSQLTKRRADLWNRDIPEMVGGYFADMSHILNSIGARLTQGGQIWMVVGDSSYAEVRIPVASILAQLAPLSNLKVVRKEPFRSMRSSAQQGGQRSLDESLVILSRP